MQRFFLSFFYLLWFNCPLIYAQLTEIEDYPKIGRPCPNYTFSKISQYSKNRVSINELQGKPVIIDFFTAGCTSCFTSFPKIDSLNEIFSGKIFFILVGYNDKYIQKIYEKYCTKYNLNLPITFDTTCFKLFRVPSVPHIVWIDQLGIIKAITSSSAMTEENIRDFLEGKDFKYNDESVMTHNLKNNYQNNEGYTIQENTLYASRLEAWSQNLNPQMPDQILDGVNKLEIVGASLKQLYNLAYGGTTSHIFGNPLYETFCYDPILKVRESSIFVANPETEKNLYNYYLIVPPEMANSITLKQLMQKDLQTYFGYSANVKMKRMPCWKLIIKKDFRKSIKSCGDGLPLNNTTSLFDIYLKNSPDGLILKNRPVKLLLRAIWAYHQLEPPFIDETKITGNVDIVVDAVMTDMNDIILALKKNGLSLVKRKKLMKVVVIQD